MAIGRKGSRCIVVDGTTYRWRLRRRPTYSQGLCWLPSTYAVEHAETPGTTLVVTTNQPHASNWVGKSGAPVLPADVAVAVASALRQGWSPTRPGSPLHLDLSDEFTLAPASASSALGGLT
ncbi:hypothetical protein ACFT7U_28750 [Streptomyces rochei]|uniref:hypothetical protein n=1 Tax=Streptomyces rochei TaxID=1928 RepID=UPI00362571F8